MSVHIGIQKYIDESAQSLQRDLKALEEQHAQDIKTYRRALQENAGQAAYYKHELTMSQEKRADLARAIRTLAPIVGVADVRSEEVDEAFLNHTVHAAARSQQQLLEAREEVRIALDQLERAKKGNRERDKTIADLRLILTRGSSHTLMVEAEPTGKGPEFKVNLDKNRIEWTDGRLNAVPIDHFYGNLAIGYWNHRVLAVQFQENPA
jgi:hypothetical protein